MQQLTVEIYSQPTNNAVLRLPGRQYPGVLVQGDSLWTLYQTALAICRRSALQQDPELTDEAESLRETLAGMVERYEKILEENQMSLPYPK